MLSTAYLHSNCSSAHRCCVLHSAKVIKLQSKRKFSTLRKKQLVNNISTSSLLPRRVVFNTPQERDSSGFFFSAACVDILGDNIMQSLILWFKLRKVNSTWIRFVVSVHRTGPLFMFTVISSICAKKSMHNYIYKNYIDIYQHLTFPSSFPVPPSLLHLVWQQWELSERYNFWTGCHRKRTSPMHKSSLD